jgi:hypothetical protein
VLSAVLSFFNATSPERDGGWGGGRERERERERAYLGIFHNGGSRAPPRAMNFEMLLQGAH